MSDVSPNRSVMIVLAYLWPLALVPLLLEDKDQEVRWHARHGLVLMVAEMAIVFVYLVFVAFTSVVSLAALAVGMILALGLVAGWIGILAVHVIAILKGVNGGRLMIPKLSAFADRF